MHAVKMMSMRGAVILFLCAALSAPPNCWGQEVAQPPEGNQKYKLTILEGATEFKRVKKGRVSSQAVVKITDRNDVPVPGIAVSFTVPQLVGGGSSFANGALTSLATTNSLGVASSGALTTGTTGASFSMSVTASVPGTALTASVPVNMTAAAGAAGGGAGGAAAGGAGAAAGVSTGVIVAVVAGVGAAVAGVAKALAGGNDKSTPAATTAAGPRGAIGAPGSPTFGPPR